VSDGPSAAEPSFADLADDLFVALQLAAERQAVLRSIVNLIGERGVWGTMLAQEEARSQRLGLLLNLVFGLIPFEDEARAALAAILAGSRQK